MPAPPECSTPDTISPAPSSLCTHEAIVLSVDTSTGDGRGRFSPTLTAVCGAMVKKVLLKFSNKTKVQ